MGECSAQRRALLGSQVALVEPYPVDPVDP